MGDRFYEQQKKSMSTRWRADGSGKAKRRLKKDVIADITSIIGTEIEGLSACTVATLEKLNEVLNEQAERS